MGAELSSEKTRLETRLAVGGFRPPLSRERKKGAPYFASAFSLPSEPASVQGARRAEGARVKAMEVVGVRGGDSGRTYGPETNETEGGRREMKEYVGRKGEERRVATRGCLSVSLPGVSQSRVSATTTSLASPVRLFFFSRTSVRALLNAIDRSLRRSKTKTE